MQPVETVGQVFTAIQQVKLNAPAFCTNFFPLERKLQGWIDHAELSGEVRNGTALFLRKDRDFSHLYFSAASMESLGREIALLPGLKTEPIVVDLIGNEDALRDLQILMEGNEFLPYQKLRRMARINPSPLCSPDANGASVSHAVPADAPAMLDLLNCAFDRYAEQLPMPYEIEAAIDNRQILVVRHDGALAGLLFFETQGLTSALRYWLVSEPFRAFHLGSALMQQYFAVHRATRRFILWVLAGNENTIQKYQHYGYAADGLIDLVLANKIIRA